MSARQIMGNQSFIQHVTQEVDEQEPVAEDPETSEAPEEAAGIEEPSMLEQIAALLGGGSGERRAADDGSG